MARPFVAFDREPPAGLLDMKRSVEEEYARLEYIFEKHRTHRYRRVRGEPFTDRGVLHLMYELTTLYALRGLKLAEGAVLLIEANNTTATLPVNRSLLELWLASVYAELVKIDYFTSDDRNKKENAASIMGRLVIGRTGRPEAPPIPFKKIKGRVLEHFRVEGKDPDDNFKLHLEAQLLYDELTDGSHPTQFGLMAHPIFGPNEEMDWVREPDPYPGYPLSHVNAALSSLVITLRGLVKKP